MSKTVGAIVMITACLFGRACAERYEPTEASLARHDAVPEWLMDAKIGIYFHWGVYSVPAFDSEWYPRKMNLPGDRVYEHHRQTYGDPSEFGYHHFVPMFKAEHFDPEEWADLFQKAGARFAGPVAEHHDGFSMWASKLTPWNVQEMGPKRDVLGEIFQSLEKRGLKTIATFHHARNLQRYDESEWENKSDNKFANSHYPYRKDGFTGSDDPKLQYLYGNMPEEKWNEEIWLGKLKEVIDGYRPDIIYFDSWMDSVPLDYRYRFSACYLNAALKWGKEVAIVRKQDDLPLIFSINDHEKSREPRALPQLWMTDDTISTGSWCYTANLKIKPLYKVVHALIDTVSKNGVMLLNISPKANGTIPAEQRELLLGLGDWLEKNGEAIYGTRPWIEAAEGPTAEPGGGFEDRKKFLALEYTAKDIRYTASRDGSTIYAILLGVPEAENAIVLETFAKKNVAVDRVTLLAGEEVRWESTADGLKIEGVDSPEDALAVIFKISLK
jgi:alpha-L-fucosidase